MTKFDEAINNLKTKINSLITSDMDTTKIEEISALNKDVDELKNKHDSLASEYGSLKDKFIEAIKHTGTSENKQEHNEEPKTLEDFGREILERDSKK